MCNPGDYVVGFRQKVDRTNADKTSLNGIELICGNNKKIFSAQMGWGEWSEPVRCPRGQHADGFWIKQQGPQGDGDDTAANAFNLICRVFTNSNSTLIANNDGRFGDWKIHACSRFSFICGLRVQIQRDQGRSGDNTALNNVDIRCCE